MKFSAPPTIGHGLTFFWSDLDAERTKKPLGPALAGNQYNGKAPPTKFQNFLVLAVQDRNAILYWRSWLEPTLQSERHKSQPLQQDVYSIILFVAPLLSRPLWQSQQPWGGGASEFAVPGRV